MFYDAEKLVLEEVRSFATLARLLKPAYLQPEIRTRGTLDLLGFELVEVYDAVTEKCLGNWEDDLESFDFAGAESSVVDKLDEHLRRHFKMKKRVRRRWIPPGGKRPVGRDFKKYYSPIPLPKVGQAKLIESLEEFFFLISNAEIAVYIALGRGLCSRHQFEAYKNHILHESMVDGSHSCYTKKQFERSFYAKTLAGKAMFLGGTSYSSSL